MRALERRPPARAPRATGAAILFVLLIVMVLAIAGVALVRIAGGDRVEAAKLGVKDRGVACAEAGLQYGRTFFGSRYVPVAGDATRTYGWGDYLGNPALGYRWTPGTARPNPIPVQAQGKSNGTSFDAGADLDGDGVADFWVSIRDDDDERPLGIADDPARDNNETIVIRAECVNPAWAVTEGGQPTNVALETVLTHIQGSSGYGTVARESNATDLVGGAQ